jgi:dynein heavy chain
MCAGFDVLVEAVGAVLPCRHYAMFVGNTGTGKTAIMMNKLRSMDPEAMAYTAINMNSFSDAPSLQVMMEQPLEKKSGVRYGPPGSRRCVKRGTQGNAAL